MRLLDPGAILSAMLRPVDDLLEESGDHAIVLDLNSLSLLDQKNRVHVQAWSRSLPCPVIGVGPEESTATGSVDVLASSASELDNLLRRIAANPQAATVLVQVLRAIEHLSPPDALVVESLGYATLQSGDEFQRWLAQYREQHPPAPVAEQTPAVNEGPAILLSRSADQLSVKLNRPDSDNAYSVEMRDALMEAFTLVNLDDSIRKVQVSAAGRCFCTGGDLSEFGTALSPASAHGIRSSHSPARLLLSAPERYHFHVHGACVGSGIELPACAGYLTADAKTLFWLPELAMGLIPGAGGCVSISRRIGRHRTAFLVLTNKKIDARKALEWGLIDAITPAPA